MWLPKQAKQLTSILANRQARAGQRPARAQPMAERLSVADLRRRKQNGFFDQALVATRDAGERCARPEARRLQTSRSKKDRGLAEALRRTQFATQGQPLSISAVDAHVLHQSCRQDATGHAEETARTRQGRTQAPVSSRGISRRCGAQAARTLFMNRSSSWRSRVLSVDRVCAESSTSADAAPVSAAPLLT